MTKLGHHASLDLSDTFASEVEVLPNFLKRSGLSAVETKAQPQDFLFTIVVLLPPIRSLVSEVRADELVSVQRQPPKFNEIPMRTC
jgi:hypothetical protein